MVISSLATNKAIKHMSVDQKEIRHQLLLDFKVTVIHVRSMVKKYRIVDLMKNLIGNLKVKAKNIRKVIT